MGASRLIKHALLDENMTQYDLADAVGKDHQQVRNALYRDTFNFSIAEEWLNAIGYEIVIRKKDTNKIIG